MAPCDEPHFNLGLGGYKSCICLCNYCLSAISAQCICKNCSCKDKTQPLRNHEPVPTEMVPETVQPPVEHPCSVCGKEVVRQGTRGRWPSKCMECK